MSGVDSLLTLFLVARPQLALDFATHALHGGSGDHAFWGATDAHHDVHGVHQVILSCGNGTGYVAVTDQAHLGAGFANLADEVLVAMAIQHHHGDATGYGALGLGHSVDVVGHGSLDVHHAHSLGAHGQLVHVEHGRWVVHGTALSSCDHGDCVRATLGHQRGAVHWIHSDVHGGTFAVAHFFAVVQHGGFVLFALTDDNHATHGHGVDHLAHGIHRGTVAGFLLPASDPLAGSQGCCLGNTNQLHGQVAVWGFVLAISRRIDVRRGGHVHQLFS